MMPEVAGVINLDALVTPNFLSNSSYGIVGDYVDK